MAVRAGEMAPSGAVGSNAPFRRLKILYSHRTQSRDGQAVHIEELIGALRALGHEVIIVEPRSAVAKFGNEPKAARAAKKYLPGYLYELLELGYGFIELVRLAAACRQHRPDVLYQRANIYMPSGVVCARLFGVPFLLEVNSPLADERKNFGSLKLPRLAALSEEAAWRAADYVLPVTRVLADAIEHAGVPRERIVVLPNGVDLSRFTPRDDTAMRRRLALEGRLVLGFAGFIREWHQADAIVALLADGTLPAGSHFLIVGDGPVREALVAQARRLGVTDRVTITGVVPRDQVADYIQCFDIALQPHVVSYASPLKILEYMALARAIIAPGSDNIRELLVQEESALLFEPGNPAALAAAVRRLAADETLRRRLGVEARKTVLDRPLTWRHNASVIEGLARTAACRRACHMSCGTG